jgi:hypothetical protein
MITFVPEPSFSLTAQILDWQRLGKQRSEAKVILESNLRGEGPLYKTLMAKMWRGYNIALAIYTIEICSEWKKRGFQDNISHSIIDLIPDSIEPSQLWLKQNKPELLPAWIGDPRVHDSHKGRLLAKNPIYYARYNWSILPAEKYFYPGTIEEYQATNPGVHEYKIG